MAEAETATLESQLAALEQAELNAPEYKATIQEVDGTDPADGRTSRAICC